MKHAILISLVILASGLSTATHALNLTCENLDLITNPEKYEAYFFGGDLATPAEGDIIRVGGDHAESLSQVTCIANNEGSSMLANCPESGTNSGYFAVLEGNGGTGGIRARVLYSYGSEQDSQSITILNCY